LLHLGLCGSVAQLPPDATFEVHVRASDKLDQTVVDRVFAVRRGNGDRRDLDFEMPWGIYRFDTSVPASNCSASTYVSLLPDRDRGLTQTLADGTPQPAKPILLDGIAPPSLVKFRTTFVLLDADAIACSKALPDPLPSHLDLEADAGAYYGALYPDPSLKNGTNPLLAMRIETDDDKFHYIAVAQLATGWAGWPTSVRFDVTQRQIEQLSTWPDENLLCPERWQTGV
jgi:hypothetical protein